MRILYIVSLFPCWSETFIVREITELIRSGAEVRILSLKRPSETMVQSDAENLAQLAIYPPSALRTVLAGISAITTHPSRELGELGRIFQSFGRHPLALVKTLAVWWRSIALLSNVRIFSPDHVHAHWATYPSTSAMLISERLNIPYSFTAHAHDIFLEHHLLSEKIATAKFVVAISDFNKRFLCCKVDGADRATIRVIHCGVYLSDFPANSCERDERAIIAVGRLDEIKGFSHLIDACAILRTKGIEFRCTIIGSGPLENVLAAQIEKLDLTNLVTLGGAQKQEVVRSMLMQSGIFALPCVVTARGNRDGIPVALMEAMASGIPVVSTRVSGVPELVEHGVTGLLADPGNASDLAMCLESLLVDQHLAAAVARNARQRVELDFNIQIEVAKLLSAFTSNGT